MAQSIYGDEVGATLVTPLYARAHADVAGANVQFDDEQARTVWAELQRYAAAHGAASPESLAITDHNNVLGTIRRSLLIDQATWRFAVSHPGTQVITLGIGLCNRRSRLADLSASFTGVDREAVVELRRRLMPTDSTTLVTGSVTDDAWLAGLNPDAPTMVIAEGLLMYLSSADVTTLLSRVAFHFGRGTGLLADVFHPTAARFGHPITQATGAAFQSGHAGATGLAEEAPGWRAVDNMDIMRHSGFLPAQWSAAFSMFSGASMYTVAELEYTGE